MILWTSNKQIKQPTLEQVASTLRDFKRLGEDWAYLGDPDQEIFIHTMPTEHGWLLEKREGGSDRHFEAVPRDGRERIEFETTTGFLWMKKTVKKGIFYYSIEEVIEAFGRYLHGKMTEDLVSWNRIEW